MTPRNDRLVTRTTASRAAASIVATLSLAACNRAAQPQAQSANEPRTVGQQIDTAIDRTQRKLSEVGDKAAEKLSEAGKKTEQAVSGAADKLASHTGEATSSTTTTTTTASSTSPGVSFNTADASRAVSDAAITASIKTDFLKDPDLSVLKIDVDTKSGVVTLNGLANDESARGRAEKMASSVKGVKEVRNFLVVKRA